MIKDNWKPRVGDWAEIRPVAQILRTLDARGDCESMPFMPEMLRFAGRRFQVSAVAHKTCDTVNKTGGRKVDRAVHLADLRCNGAAHGACQAACLLFWKTAWLKPADGPGDSVESAAEPGSSVAETYPVLAANCSSRRTDGVEVYRCQATTLPQWSKPLRWWSAAQYWADVRSGNATWRRMASTLFLAALRKLRRLPVGYRFNCWLYDAAHRWLRGSPDPQMQPAIQGNGPTPGDRLDLSVGETVEIRGLAEISATVNQTHRNRGLYIDAEETRYCGRRARVAGRVTQIINEQTGEMMHFSNPCIVLEGIFCHGDYSEKRLLCPRRIPSYWREVWLKRVD